MLGFTFAILTIIVAIKTLPAWVVGPWPNSLAKCMQPFPSNGFPGAFVTAPRTRTVCAGFARPSQVRVLLVGRDISVDLLDLEGCPPASAIPHVSPKAKNPLPVWRRERGWVA